MSKVSITVRESDIQRAIKQRVIVPITKTVQSPYVMRDVGNQAVKILDRYVPKKTGDLRRSVYIRVNPGHIRIIWGNARVGKTISYAAYQHNADDSTWRRTTPGTKSWWTDELQEGTHGYTKLIQYTAKVVKKEVKRNGG